MRTNPQLEQLLALKKSRPYDYDRLSAVLRERVDDYELAQAAPIPPEKYDPKNPRRSLMSTKEKTGFIRAHGSAKFLTLPD